MFGRSRGRGRTGTTQEVGVLSLSVELLERKVHLTAEVLQDLLRDDMRNRRVEKLKAIEDERAQKCDSGTQGLSDGAERVVEGLIHEVCRAPWFA